ncbi:MULTISPECIES: hypothetical protein [Alphaproteobacteria]|uniref:Uncharacterized protein n=2 Tax=Alphaproteobacteria TaxID=28211 RepID=A0A512HI51_9HYPH|nr:MULTISPECIES: hypothetical protein [Alphaproteobacteria]GEO85125.1 hypothetical protein RNA01_20570 [Ciceribacter naphthalenivorans]GLR24541.1 hypothetical protein GCM10007920_43350 [Ciceribacter naphthalenivorans]GLT07397.1 hypothetical protein GCM10007926_43350 [Sphingomonas psychrolutea]
MILEALNYAASWPLTTPGHRPFIRYSVNLWSRAARCSSDWRTHEENCKAAVLAAVAGLKQRRTAVVLGSGLLRDVPIIELSRAFDTVVLFDLVHLASVRSWLARKRLKNIRLIERDLSGYADLAAGKEPDPLGFLRQLPYLDFVVSANLLSQIGMGASKRLERDANQSTMPDDTVARLIRAHLAGLGNLAADICLLTDIAYEVIDRTGKVHERFDLLHGVAVPEHCAEWLWPVAPLGEESKDYRVVHRVIAA